jgi:hypothetical protein
VRPDQVVVDAPRFDLDLRVDHADKPVFVQAFVAELAVEAFDIRVLDRLARANETNRDTRGVGPRVERPAGEFGTVVPSAKEVMTGQLLL